MIIERHAPHLLINGAPVVVSWEEIPFGGHRCWFECPTCSRRCRFVYMRDSLACRKCSGLDFASRHLHRSTPQVHRIRRLREQIGADLAPFSPLPERPRYYKRFWRVVARILLEEQSLVAVSAQ